MIGPRSLFRILLFNFIMKLQFKMMSYKFASKLLHAGVDLSVKGGWVGVIVICIERGTSEWYANFLLC